MSGRVQRAFVVDLLALSPFYDRYLVEALSHELSSTLLYSASFPYEPDYWDNVPVNRAPGLQDRVATLGVKNRWLRRALQLVEYGANWLKLVRDTRRHQVDVVHIEWLPLLEVADLELLGVQQLKHSGAKVVYTAHNALPHDSAARVIRRYQKAYRLMDQIIVHTQREQDTLVERLRVPPRKITIVPHGPMFHDLPLVSRQVARRRFELNDEEVVLFLGLLRPYKGIEDLLEAMAHVVRERPRAELLLAGQGKPAYQRSLVALTERLGLLRHVQMLAHYVPVAEIPSLYAAADVAVLPYREASQSGALYTAASFDAPLVATAVGGLAEVLEPGGRALLVPPGDPEAFAAGVVELLRRPPEARRALAACLSEWASQECGWGRIAKRTVEVYQSALANRTEPTH